MPENKSIAGAGPSVSPATEVMDTDWLPRVSVIVPTFRDAADLARCLASLRRQTYPAALLEFLFVDNTPEFTLAAKAAEYAPARILHEPRPGSYAARNRAITEASGDVLAFTDADCLPEPAWIAEGVKALAAHSGGALVAGGVEVFAADPARPTAAELFELARAFPQERYVTKYRFGVTANVFVTRGVIERAGPFLDNLASGGDYEFGQRVHAAGFPVVYVAQASVRHPARNRLSMVFGKSRRVLHGVHELERQGRLPQGAFLRGFLSDLRPPVQTCWKMLGDPRLGGVVGGLRAAWVMILWRYYRAGYRMRLMLGGK